MPTLGTTDHDGVSEKPPARWASASEAVHVLSTALLCGSCAWIMWNATWFFVPLPKGDVVPFVFTLLALVGSGPVLAAISSLYGLRNNRAPRKSIRIAVGGCVTFSFVVTLVFTAAGSIGTDASDVPFKAAAGLLVVRLCVGLADMLLAGEMTTWPKERLLQCAIVASVFGTPVATVCWSYLNIPLVAWRASAIAGSKPYCVQVTGSKGDYEPVGRLRELGGFAMQAPFQYGGVTGQQWRFTSHAILVVQQDNKTAFYNWSYVAQNFVPLSENAHVSAHCEPKPQFIRSLGDA